MFSLVLALVASPQGLTKGELLSTVYGYAERSHGGKARTHLDRQFERDKEQLRRLGVPLETLDSPTEPGNNQLVRYRIAKHLLQVPADLEFDPEEVMLLRLAALAWSEGSLGADSRWASMKLASFDAAADVTHLGMRPRLDLPDPVAQLLQRAILERRAVKFEYQLADRDSPLLRHVAPLHLHRAENRWHLVSFDLDRREYRVFLLSRITSTVTIADRSYDEHLSEGVAAVIDELLALRDAQRAVLRVRRGSVAEARLSPRAGTIAQLEHETSLELGYLDLHAFAEEIVGFGDDVVVEAPEELRSSVVSILTASLHRLHCAAPDSRGSDA